MKAVENYFKKKLMVKNSFIEETYVVGTHRGNSNVYLQHMLLKLRKKTFVIYIFQVSCTLSLPLLNIQNCQSVLKFLPLYCKLFIFA